MILGLVEGDDTGVGERWRYWGWWKVMNVRGGGGWGGGDVRSSPYTFYSKSL